MKAYRSIESNREWKLSEIMILAGILSMYSGLILALLGQIVK